MIIGSLHLVCRDDVKTIYHKKVEREEGREVEDEDEREGQVRQLGLGPAAGTWFCSWDQGCSLISGFENKEPPFNASMAPPTTSHPSFTHICTRQCELSVLLKDSNGVGFETPTFLSMDLPPTVQSPQDLFLD